MTDKTREFHKRRSLKALFDSLDETPGAQWPAIETVHGWIATSDGPFGEVYDELRLWLEAAPPPPSSRRSPALARSSWSSGRQFTCGG